MCGDKVNEYSKPTPTSQSQPRNTQAAWILLSVTASAGCLLIATLVACGAIATTAMSAVAAQQRQIEPVIDEFMTAMAARDTDRAYALFSARTQQYVSAADLKRWAQGNTFALFDGYQRVDLLESSVGVMRDPDPSGAQGIVAQVNGSIQYADGFTGRFEAVLEREGEAWRLHGIDVTVPPDKFGAGPE